EFRRVLFRTNKCVKRDEDGGSIECVSVAGRLLPGSHDWNNPYATPATQKSGAERERPSMAKPQPLIGQPINGTQHTAGQIDNSRNTKGAEPLALLVGP